MSTPRLSPSLHQKVGSHAADAAMNRLLGKEKPVTAAAKTAGKHPQVRKRPVEMLETPPKRPVEVLETPPKVRKVRSRLKVAEATFNEVMEAKKVEVDKEVEPAKLLKLFAGIDLVLQLVAGRQRHMPWGDLLEPVLAQTGCDLTDERFRQVLFLAEGMLAAYWVGEGEFAYLTVEQRDKDGKHARPQGPELQDRRRQFEARLKTTAWPCPTAELPAKPAAPQIRRLFVKPETSARQGLDLSTLPSLLPDGAGTPTQRFEALRLRVKAKEAFFAKQEKHEAQIRQVTKRIGICEDALLAVKVLTSLFDARFVSRASSAPSWRQKRKQIPAEKVTFEGLIRRARIPELKLLSALCSLTFAEQCIRPLSLEAGRAAIAQLREVGAGIWFRVEKVEDCGNFLCSLGSGSEQVRLALKARIQELDKERSELRMKGPSGPRS